MTIIEVKSNEKLEQVSRAGNDAIVHLNEVISTITNQDKTTSTVYTYTAFMFSDAVQYQDDSLILQATKGLKELNLSKITVTTSKGNLFDGNDKARANMLSAIQTSAILNITSTEWKMADNKTVVITLDELKEALALSTQMLGTIVKA